MPGRICAIVSCKNNQRSLKKMGSNMIFHRFPKARDFVSSSIRKKWVQRCKRADKFNVDTSSICSDHFTSDDYERDMKNELLGLPSKKVLKKTAVPTINLGETIKVVTEQTAREKRAIKKERKELVDSLLASTSKAPSVNIHPFIFVNSNMSAENLENVIPDSLQISQEIESCSDATEIRQPTALKVEAMDQEKNENSYKKKYETLQQKYNNLKMTSRKKIKCLNAMLKYYKTKFYKISTTATGRRKKKNEKILKVSDANKDFSNGLLVGGAVPKRAWFHIGKVKNKEATPEMWLEWLKGDNEDEDFIVEKLNSPGNFSSFKVGAPIHLLQKLKDENYWPPGVTVRLLQFPKRKQELPIPSGDFL